MPNKKEVLFTTFDKYVIRQFIPPFLGAFMVALFVLMMQFLWLYIDEMIGKGLSIWHILEMLSYLLVTLFQWSCALGVLISSVMLFGGLSERYELSSMKSAGVSLFRIMRPLIILVSGLVVLSIIVGGYVVPKAQLKFRSRLYDIRTSKATLNLEKDVFNTDFKGYSIRIKDKDRDGRTIYGVMMYRQTGENNAQMQLIQAEKGEMYFTSDKRYFIMKLYNGTQIEELTHPIGILTPAPFVRSRFKEYRKIFDLAEFQVNKTDEKLFRNQLSVMTSFEIRKSIDSLNGEAIALNEKSNKDVGKSYESIFWVYPDSLQNMEKLDTSHLAIMDNPLKQKLKEAYMKSTKHDNNTNSESRYDLAFISMIKGNSDPKIFPEIINEAIFKTNDLKSRIDFGINTSAMTNKVIAQQVNEFHKKLTFGIISLVFLLIGAPMGSVVRKGGFGYPLLVSIFFFMLFIILTMIFQELGEIGTLTPTLGAWMPNFILLSIGLVLMLISQKDLNFKDFFKQIFSKS